MNITIFSTIGLKVNDFLALLKNTAELSTKLNELQAVVGTIIVITIMYKGYLVLAGRNQDPIRDLVWDIARKMFILTFVLNVNGWLDQSIQAINGFYEWAGGGTSLYTQMDKVANVVCSGVTALWNKNDIVFGFGDKITSFFVILIIIIAFLAISFELFFTIIATSVTNAFLIVAFPLALFCFMFNQTKQVFTQWCNLFISNIFLLLFLLVFTDFFINNIQKIFNLESYIAKNASFIQIIIEISLISAVLVQFVRVIKDLAKNLAQVTLDSSINGIGFSRLAGGVTRKVANVGTGMVRGALGSGAVDAFKSGGVGGLSAYGGIQSAKHMGNIGKQMLSSMRNK